MVDEKLKKVYYESLDVVVSALGKDVLSNGYNIKEVRINNRLKKVHGRCITYYNTKHSEIEIASYMLNVDYKELKTTMIHEILHSLKNCQCHTGKWKEYANIVSVKTQYNITRCRNIEGAVDYKYVFKCKTCGKLVKRIRQSNFTKHPENYHCAYCGGKFEQVL